MNEFPIPFVTDELIEYLARIYPRNYARPGTDLSEIYFQGGQQSVIEHLRELKAQQDEDNLVLTQKVIKDV